MFHEATDLHPLSSPYIETMWSECAVDSNHFESSRTFIDILVLKRRNAIAHGQQEYIQQDGIDDLVADILALMTHFRNLLENKIYQNNMPHRPPSDEFAEADVIPLHRPTLSL
jgi:hypothetical protein